MALVSGKVFGFEWRAALWVPLFQFELRDLSVKQNARGVLAGLSPVFDGSRLAVLFAQPNSRRQERSPVDLLESDLQAMRDAARADRFVATG